MTATTQPALQLNLPTTEKSFPARLTEPRDSYLLNITGSWNLQSFTDVRVTKGSETLKRAVKAFDEALFDVSGWPLNPVYWSELFGQIIPQGDSDRTNSARVTLTEDYFEQLKGGHLERILTVCDIVQRDLMNEIVSGRDSDVTITRTSVSVISRLCSRIPAQRMHVDGDSSSTRSSNIISVIVAVRRQRGVVFLASEHDAGNTTEQMTSPTLDCGDRVEFDQSRVTHVGHSVTAISIEEMVSHTLFMTFCIRRKHEETRPVKPYVDVSPDVYHRHGSSAPSVAKCICCAHLMIERRVNLLQSCPICLRQSLPSHDPLCQSYTRNATAICTICSKYPTEVIPQQTLLRVLENAPNGSINAFMSQCALTFQDPNHADYLCPHSSSLRIPFPPELETFLYFDLGEIREAATWLIALLTTTFNCENTMGSDISGMKNLSEFSSMVATSCKRKRAITDMILSYAGICNLKNPFDASLALVAADESSMQFQILADRLRKLGEIVCNPRGDWIVRMHRVMRKMFRDKLPFSLMTTNDLEFVDFSCSCRSDLLTPGQEIPHCSPRRLDFFEGTMSHPTSLQFQAVVALHKEAVDHGYGDA